ncbi:MAG: hypothetical protein JNM62_05370 [Flavobacteriales bacterium]|nr:hypothetical protein [Flavobacteriales bacterium]
MKKTVLWILAALAVAVLAFIIIAQWLDDSGCPPGELCADDNYVSLPDYNCLACDFKNYFIAKEANGTDCAPPCSLKGDIRVDLPSFQAALDYLVQNYSYDDHGIVIHHGLRREQGHFQYRPEIEFVGLKDKGNDEWEIMTLPNYRYSIDPDGKLVTPDPVDDWAAYKTHMHRKLNTTDNDHTPVVEGADVRFYLFRHNNRLEKLLNQNKTYAPTHLMISSIAEPTRHIENDPAKEDDDEMEGMRHHIALALCMEKGAPLIDGRNYPNQNYRMKALDVGSPCPYRCAVAELPAHGIPVRKNCNPTAPGCTISH